MSGRSAASPCRGGATLFPGLPGRQPLHVKLVGNTNATPFQSTRDAIGARVELTADLNGSTVLEPGETQIQEVHSGSSNSASTSSLLLEFGVGLAVRATIRVLWPSGAPASVFNAVAVNQCVVIDETTRHPDPERLLSRRGRRHPAPRPSRGHG